MTNNWKRAVTSIMKSIPCPLCGNGMVWEGVAWFCRAGKKRTTGDHAPCGARCTETALEKFRFALRGNGGEQDGFQFFADPISKARSAIHAVAVDNGGIVIASARFVPETYNRTDFMVCTENEATPEDVVEFFKNGGEWLLAPWFEEEENV